ncbi:hypothetical protein E4U46_008295, partial [Claviceps purpurea]
MKTSFVLGAASAMASIGAASRNLVATQSRVTDTAPLPGLGASPPKITPPPGLDDIQKDVFKRDYDRVAPPVTVLLAPDNTCGWISGSSASPYLCNSGDTCCLILPPLTGPGFISCSNRGRRDVLYPQYVKCFDYSNYHASTDCGECHNENVVKCRGILDFRCESTREPLDNDIFGTSRVNWVETTWAGQTSSRTYVSEVVMIQPTQNVDSTVSELASKSIISASPKTSRSSGGDSSERDISKTSIDPTGATNRAPNGSSGLDRPPEIDMGRNNRGTPIGAIVGGV